MQKRLEQALERASYYIQMKDVLRSTSEREKAYQMYKNEISKVNLLKRLLELGEKIYD